MIFVITAISAIVPSLLLIWYFWTRDVEREPGRVLWATFGLGVLSIVPVVLIELGIDKLFTGVHEPLARGALEAFFTASMTEEAAKLAILLWYCDRRPEFDEPMDGIVYGAAASIGFATLENVLYVASGGLGVAIMRALTAVPGHAFLGAILGYHVGQAKFFPAKRKQLIAQGFVMAWIFHGLYDWPLLAHKQEEVLHKGAPMSALALVTLAALVIEWAWVVRQVRRLRVDQLHVAAVRAVQAGVAPPEGVLTAAPVTSGARVRGWIAIVGGGLLAAVGGLMLLAGIVVAASAKPGTRADHDGIIAVVMFGLIPASAGAALIWSGRRRMQPQKPISPYVQA